MVINNYKLDKIARDYARQILDELNPCDCGGDSLCQNCEARAARLAHEFADDSEWIIYYNKAHELCQNCDTENGEELLEREGTHNLSYNAIASRIAFGELRARIEHWVAFFNDECFYNDGDLDPTNLRWSEPAEMDD